MLCGLGAKELWLESMHEVESVGQGFEGLTDLVELGGGERGGVSLVGWTVAQYHGSRDV